MAQTGFTPIQLYSSSTTGNTPAAADLLNSSGGSELAINIFDGKLFYKDSSGNVQVIGWKVVPVSAGGTGQTSYTDGQLLIGNSTGNTLTKATLTAGSGVTITNGAGAITINATGSGGTVTSVAALTLGTTGTDLSSTVANGTTTPVITLNVPTASATNRGALSAADWTTFNNKQPAGTYVTNLTGPITSVGNATSIASQTGTGTKFVVDTSPTLVTPVLGVATATSLNKMAITAPATSSTLAVADGKTFTASKTLTLTGTDSTTMTFPTTSATIARTDAAQTFTGDQTFSGTVTSTSLFRAAMSTASIGTYRFSSPSSNWGPQDSYIGFTPADAVNAAATFSVNLWNGSGSQINRLVISPTGITTMSGYGAGAATFSAAGVISSVSDETWKTKDGIPLNPDAMLQKLEPGYWYYNEEKAPIFGADRQLGFYAQNVNYAIGAEAAPVPEEGKPWGYYDRSVLAVTVMSLQKALATIENLTLRLEILEKK